MPSASPIYAARGFAAPQLRAGVPAWLAQLQQLTSMVDHQPIGHRDGRHPTGAALGDVATTILILASMVLATQAE